MTRVTVTSWSSAATSTPERSGREGSSISTDEIGTCCSGSRRLGWSTVYLRSARVADSRGVGASLATTAFQCHRDGPLYIPTVHISLPTTSHPPTSPPAPSP